MSTSKKPFEFGTIGLINHISVRTLRGERGKRALRHFLGMHMRPAPLKNRPYLVVRKLKNYTPF